MRAQEITYNFCCFRLFASIFVVVGIAVVVAAIGMGSSFDADAEADFAEIRGKCMVVGIVESFHDVDEKGRLRGMMGGWGARGERVGVREGLGRWGRWGRG